MILRVSIKNYRLFRDLQVEFVAGANVIVGDNDSGKSTLIEAINLAMTGRVDRSFHSHDICPYLINTEAALEYFRQLRAKLNPYPPEIEIAVAIADVDQRTADLRGLNNPWGQDLAGVLFKLSLSPKLQDEYNAFVSSSDRDAINLVPTEYYDVEWKSFRGENLTWRSMPVRISVIDPTTLKLQSGVDYHLQRLFDDYLTENQKVELSREYRSLREAFADKKPVREVNEKLSAREDRLSEKKLSLAIDLSRRFTWERSLTPHLDELPFEFAGRGEQSSLKTLLAISRKAEKSQIVLIEEPENHLSFATLNQLVANIKARCDQKQIIIATHSSFVLNKLGLANLVLLSKSGASRITDLEPDTIRYFQRLSGYDTLRIVLAKHSILVEGPSDELVVQRAYLDKYGQLPIYDGIDVMSVGSLAFRRFIELAKALNKRITVVTDNDGNLEETVRAKFLDPDEEEEHVKICVGATSLGNSLESQLVSVNDLRTLKKIFGQKFQTKGEIETYISKKGNKTEAALRIFEAAQTIIMPGYIEDAIEQ